MVISQYVTTFRTILTIFSGQRPVPFLLAAAISTDFLRFDTERSRFPLDLFGRLLPPGERIAHEILRLSVD